MSRLSRADAIVVGLGAMGSAVTFQLARRGLRVVGIDRFRPPHDRGSTHGETRISRIAIGEGAEHVPLVRRSHELWRQIEEATGAALLHQVGGLVIGDRDDPFLARTRAAASLYEVAHENLSGRQLTTRFPMFTTPARTEAYLEPGAGFVRPEAAVAAQLSLARRAGAQLRLGETVRSWVASGDGVTVTTDAEVLEAGELVLCAGAWITRLLPEAASLFAVYPQLLHWFPISRGYDALREMPVFIWEMDGERDGFTHLAGGFYGFPAIDGPGGGIKVATERYEATIDPDEQRDARAADAAAAELHRAYLARYFPWVSAEPLRSASCLYTNTDGCRFMIGPDPVHANVTVVAACSGHGFKHSPAIGEAVAQTIVDGRSEIDLSPFALPSRLVADAG
ncbi:MAG TPA: N-methyl-L-tryptophan oxidase [Solirubrobacteraceae bacterium]|nr:N-methyl-L-tryptophan oxidase [Solirubrobacteraceae bacterium]